MGAEQGQQQNVANINENKENNDKNKKEKKKRKSKKEDDDSDGEESGEESDEEESGEESDEDSEKDKKKEKENKKEKEKENEKISEKEKEIKPNLETITHKNNEESEKSESESNTEKKEDKENQDNKENKEIKKESKIPSVKESSELSESSQIKKEEEKKSEKEVSEEEIVEQKIDDKNKNERNKEQENNKNKKYKNVLPNEIPEERKISQASKLSFKYICCQTIESAHAKEITTLAYLLKRNEIATGSVDSTIKIWKVIYKKGEITLHKELTGHSNSITCIRDFPKLNCFCSCSSDNTIKLWDGSSLKCIKTLQYHTKCVLTCCYNPLGNKEIFSGGEDLDIIVWTTETNIEGYEEEKALKGHSKRISSLAFADDYNYLLSGSDDKTLRIWDLKNIEDIQCIKVLKDLMSPIDFLLYLNNRLIVGCEDGVISFIKMNKMKRCRSVKFSNSPIYSFNIFHKHRYLIIGSKDGKTRVWKIGTNKREVLTGHTDAVTGVCDFEDDYIITASIDKSIKLWKKS